MEDLLGPEVLRHTHVLVLQQHPLSPRVLDDRYDARDDHAAEEHDEDAADVGQPHLRARRRRSLRRKRAFQKLRMRRMRWNELDGTEVQDGHHYRKLQVASRLSEAGCCRKCMN